MPRYFFDVHDDGPAEWDDIGRECRTSGEITTHAVSLIAQARAQQKAAQRPATTTTVMVQREEGEIVLTAIATMNVSAPPSPLMPGSAMTCRASHEQERWPHFRPCRHDPISRLRVGSGVIE
ncbi:DUF6894 family protein [Methylobacterium sp. C25]|uniref:DUF6894 family protein n=1 Tax=Methylobacterium sp. C25 TaxID=2721622 RepID=UPI003FA3C499